MPDFEYDDLFPEDAKDDAPQGKHHAVEDEPNKPDENLISRVTGDFGTSAEDELPSELVKTQRPEEHWQPMKTADLPAERPDTPPMPTIPGVREEMASTPMALELPDPTAKGPWIQYNGPATVRIMDRHAWAAAKVESEKYCEWNYLNGKRLPRKMFSDEELQYLLRVDGRFSLET